jgi:hypothetical protein
LGFLLAFQLYFVGTFWKPKKPPFSLLKRKKPPFLPVLEEEGAPPPPPPLSVFFYAFRFMLSFLLVFSLLERTPISLGLALDQPGPPNINSCILSTLPKFSPSWIVPSVPPPEGSMEFSRSAVLNLDLLFSISFRPRHALLQHQRRSSFQASYAALLSGPQVPARGSHAPACGSHLPACGTHAQLRLPPTTSSFAAAVVCVLSVM